MVYFSFFDLRESLLSLKEVLNFYDAQGRFRFQAKNQSYGYAHYSLRNAAGEEAGVIKRNPRDRNEIGTGFLRYLSKRKTFHFDLSEPGYEIFRKISSFAGKNRLEDTTGLVIENSRNHQRPRRMYRPHESEHFGLCRRRKNRDSRLCRSCDSVEPADCGRESFYLWLQVNKKEFSRVTDLCKMA